MSPRLPIKVQRGLVASQSERNPRRHVEKAVAHGRDRATSTVTGIRNDLRQNRHLVAE
jgi:hypothetical protein